MLLTRLCEEVNKHMSTETKEKCNNWMKNALVGEETNDGILSAPGDTCTFIIPWGEEFKLSRSRQDKILKTISEFIVLCFGTLTVQALLWIDIFEQYKQLLVLINQKTPFSDEDVEAFDDQSYKWCQLVITKLGIDM